MKEVFKKINFSGSISISLDKENGKIWTERKSVILTEIKAICEDYEAQGYKLTLRQLYYQLVAKDKIPNHDKVYKKLSSLKDECVYSGLVDWDIFEDRGRIPKRAYFENSVKGALERTVDYYSLNRQLNQPKHIEVWTEKDAISDILKRVTDQFTIHLVVNKGYSSSTAMYAAYQRFIEKIRLGKKIVILYFGDHDPSGLDMVRDINDRILFFLNNGNSLLNELIENWGDKQNYFDLEDEYRSKEEYWICDNDDQFYLNLRKVFLEKHFQIKAIGLTMDQIVQYKPPHNPAKITDPRAKDYVKLFGQKSWEVDALTPSIMTTIIQKAIDLEMDNEVFNKVLAQESLDQIKIKSIINNLNNQDEN